MAKGAALRTLSRRGPPVQIRSRALNKNCERSEQFAVKEQDRFELRETNAVSLAPSSNPVPRIFCPNDSENE